MQTDVRRLFENAQESVEIFMRIGIIDADLLDKGTRHPNLALMKISAYNKEQGYYVQLIEDYSDVDNYDRLYASKVFTNTSFPAELTNKPNLRRGGTGFYKNGGRSLPKDIEHHMPDYDLYTNFVTKKIATGVKRSYYADYLDYSIGFTTRGCFRKCPFCVNKKYDHAFRHSQVIDFLNQARPYVYLWDDNFLAFSGWRSILEELAKIGKPFQFRQGLDIRLLSNDHAKAFAKAKYKGDFIFAFDHINEMPEIEKHLKIWRDNSLRGTRLYVLCGYYSLGIDEVESAFIRIETLMRYGCLPYIMRYNKCEKSQHVHLFTQIARWCNQPQFFKKMSFREYCEANEKYHKNRDQHCMAFKTMLDFEANYPEIAKKYFDLKYDILNQYK